MKLQEFTEKYADLSEEQKEDLTKVIQGEQDSIRTDYSKKIKDLEKFKPAELTVEQKELVEVKNELASLKFRKELQKFGIDDDLAHFLNKDMNMKDFESFYKGCKWSNLSAETMPDFIPNNQGSFDVGITKKQFTQMNISERTKLYESSPELYGQLSK